MLARVHDNSSILKDTVKIDTTIGKDDHRKFRDQNWKVFGLKKLDKIRPMCAKYGMTPHQFACKWLLQQSALTSITATLLNEHEIKEAVESVGKPEIAHEDMEWLASEYEQDFGFGEDAHPCNLKSSTDPSGSLRSSYVPPPVFVA